MWELMQRLEAAAIELEQADGTGELSAVVRSMPERLRRTAAACGQIDAEYARLEALQDQVDAQRMLLASLGCPILRVRHDVLCAPLVGPYDRERSGLLRDAVLREVSRTRARLVVLDVTGAEIPEPSAAEHILLTCRALRLLGARCALSGLSAHGAQMLSSAGASLVDVPSFLSLEAAIQSVPP